MKDEWVNTDEGKEFNSLTSKYNIKLEKYNTGNDNIRNELIRLYTHANLGFSGGEINWDLKEKLFNLIKENNHAIIEIISDEKQQYLQTLINK
jgi:hypothetical protein